MPDAPKVVLQVNSGIEIADIKSGSVAMGLEQVAHEFTLELSDRWSPHRQQLPFNEGDPVKLVVNGELLVDGFLDVVTIEDSPDTRQLSVTGRSWTAHLGDCSALHTARNWQDATLRKVAKDICAPFGIDVQVGDVGDGVGSDDVAIDEPFARYGIGVEESALNVIQRAAAQRGVYLTTHTGRELVITGASSRRSTTVLQRGVNILSGQRTATFTQRHSVYYVKAPSAATPTLTGDAEPRGVVTVTDDQVTYYRPLVIQVDGNASQKVLERRAAWERQTRAGRARRLQLAVQGLWDHEDHLWRPNISVPVVYPLFDVDDELLVVHVRMSFDAHEGTRTQLQLAAREAFELLAPPPRHKRQARRHNGQFARMG